MVGDCDLNTEDYEIGFAEGRKSLIDDYSQEKGVGLCVSRLNNELIEAKIRLYGVLWYLCENEIISEGKARELGKRDLRKMIGDCLEHQSISNEYEQ